MQGPGLSRAAGHNALAMTSLPLDAEIAQAAARMVVEEGWRYGPAKRRAAVKAAGLPARTALPTTMWSKTRCASTLPFCADTQPDRAACLRGWRWAGWSGWPLSAPSWRAVWNGTATQLVGYLPAVVLR